MSYLYQLCSMIPRVKKEDLKELFCQIHNEAGKYQYENDRDKGAIALEEIAETIDDVVLKNEIFQHAIYRAKWCAQGATSGSEGVSRAQHLKELEMKLKIT